MSAQLEKNTQQQQLGSRSTMMDMQEVKARKPHSAAAANGSSALPQPAIGEEELDPSVQSAPLLSESERRKRHDKSVKSWVQAVLDRVWSAAFLGVAGFGLHEAQFVHELLYAREARRAWVHAGIFAASLVVFFGSYIELYRSMLLREKVSYETARTSTHAMLASMVASGIWCVARGLLVVLGWWHGLTPDGWCSRHGGWQLLGRALAGVALAHAAVPVHVLLGRDRPDRRDLPRAGAARDLRGRLPLVHARVPLALRRVDLAERWCY